MPDEHKLHVIEPIVTGDKFEYGLHRLSVPGGWVYWLQPASGALVSSFVPLPPGLAQPAPLAVPPEQVTVIGERIFSADEMNTLQEALISKLAPAADVTDGAV